MAFEYENLKINILDTPGYFDFVGEQVEALRVADCALIIIDAMSGVEVGTEKAWEMLQEANIPSIIIVNKLDRENVEFDKALSSIQALVGTKAAVLQFPVNEGTGFNKVCDVITGKTYEYDKGNSKEVPTPDDVVSKIESFKESLIETAASANEELMEKYLDGQALTPKEIGSGMKEAVLAGDMVPVI
jgi:elongation factor G